MNIIQKLFNKEKTVEIADKAGYAAATIVYTGAEIVPVTKEASKAFASGWNKAKAEAAEANSKTKK